MMSYLKQLASNMSLAPREFDNNRMWSTVLQKCQIEWPTLDQESNYLNRLINSFDTEQLKFTINI